MCVFSHPADFTPVSTIGIGRTSQQATDFPARNVKPLGLSTDTVAEHPNRTSDVNDTQNMDLQFPIVAHADLKVSRLYNTIHPDESATEAARPVFIIDPDHKIWLMMTHPINVGRNFDGILRVIDALRLGDRERIATPADWRPGDRGDHSAVNRHPQAARISPKGWEEVRSCLRLTAVG